MAYLRRKNESRNDDDPILVDAQSSPPPTKCEDFPLVAITEIPEHLRFNQYVHKGYRPAMSLADCVFSLVTFHNETVNILTHGIPLTYILLNMTALLPWDKITVPLLPYLHIMASMSPWIGSTVYHLFMNLRGDETAYKRLLQLDMAGIWVTQTFGALTSIYSSVFCLSSVSQQIIIGCYLLVSAISLYKALSADTPWGRRFCFFLQFLIRVVLLVFRLSPMGGGHPGAIKHVFLQDLLAVIGGIIGAIFVPERWFPGKFDYLFNSHHIMHVIVVAAVCHMHWAVQLDLLWLSEGTSQCSWPT